MSTFFAMVARSFPFWVFGQPPTQRTAEVLARSAERKAGMQDAFGAVSFASSKLSWLRFQWCDHGRHRSCRSCCPRAGANGCDRCGVDAFCKRMIPIMFLSFAKAAGCKVQMMKTFISTASCPNILPRIEKAEPAPCNRWSKRRFQNASEGAV